MYFNELELGMSVDIAPVIIDKQKMLDFAYDYDNIPLHTDEEYAKKTPFGKLLAPGVMTFLSVWAKYLEVDFFGEELIAGKSTKIEWFKPVFAEDELFSKATITKLTQRNHKNGIVEVTIEVYIGERKFLSLEEILAKKNGYFAILDGIEDPFNFGYALRSLYSAGVDGVILPERNFFTATETVVRSSAGASELLPCCTVPDLAEACSVIKSHGIKLVSTAKNDKAKDVFHTNFRRPLCVIYGGERRGISAGVMEQCDAVVKIKYPRNCHYSLPACSAISILSFEIGRKLNEYKR